MYAVLIYFMTMPFVWFSIFATGIGIVGLSYLLNLYVDERFKMNKFDLYYEEVGKDSPNWTALALKSSVGVLWALAVIYFCCVCCHARDIRISVSVLSTSSTIMFQNMFVVLVPLVSGCLLLAWMAWWLYCFMYLISTGKITQPKHGSQLKLVELDEKTWGMVAA